GGKDDPDRAHERYGRRIEPEHALEERVQRSLWACQRRKHDSYHDRRQHEWDGHECHDEGLAREIVLGEDVGEGHGDEQRQHRRGGGLPERKPRALPEVWVSHERFDAAQRGPFAKERLSHDALQWVDEEDQEERQRYRKQQPGNGRRREDIPGPQALFRSRLAASGGRSASRHRSTFVHSPRYPPKRRWPLVRPGSRTF